MLVTSSWVRDQPWIVAKESRILAITSFATGEKVSRKSIPSCCVLPLATRRALCCFTVPSARNLILYTHLQPTGCFPGGRERIDQVPLISKTYNLTFIASRHTWDSIAWKKVCGVVWEVMAKTNVRYS